MSIRTAELLAPAKNIDCGIAAINHGADAVYIAAHKFGAREAAANSIADIEKLVRHAHKYYAKVYLTLNTIIYENELEDARLLAKQAYDIGCDALIVQDMALLEMDIPPIPLHASTQTNNLTPEKVKFLAGVGFSRVVLARELSLNEITAIHAQTNVELEGFVHGALCVSHSGQCYLSQTLTERSANRGCCSQPCRSAYDLLDASGKTLVKNKYLLSLRDFNLSNRLLELYNAGITSFKIEGRLKDVGYVKNITAYYRKQLDKAISKNTGIKKASSGNVYLNFEPTPERSFNRGFTSYFIDGKKGKIASVDTPKAKGELLGKATRKDAQYFMLNTSIAVNNGDGICFFNRQSTLVGTNINRAENGRIYPSRMDGIEVGTEIFRNHNHSFEKQLLATNSAKRLINANVIFTATEQAVTITVTDEDGANATLTEPQNGETAKNAEMAEASLKKGLEKTGDSIFSLSAVIQWDKAYFYSASAINEWRRRLTELLEHQRLKQHIRQEYGIQPNSIPYPEKELSYLGNVANPLAHRFYKRHGVVNIDEAFEIAPDSQAGLMFTHYCIRRELGMCTKGKVAGNAESLYLYNNGRRLKVEFDCKRCGMKISLIK